MREQISAMTPRLRRYARALLTGDPGECELADTLVQATLMRALGKTGPAALADLPVRLFATITQLHRNLEPAQRSELAVGGSRRAFASCAPGASSALPNDLASALLALPMDEREALLLVTLESFDHATVARILRISRPVLFARLTRARTALGQHLSGKDARMVAKANTRVPYLRLVVG